MTDKQSHSLSWNSEESWNHKTKKQWWERHWGNDWVLHLKNEESRKVTWQTLGHTAKWEGRWEYGVPASGHCSNKPQESRTCVKPITLTDSVSNEKASCLYNKSYKGAMETMRLLEEVSQMVNWAITFRFSKGVIFNFLKSHCHYEHLWHTGAQNEIKKGVRNDTILSRNQTHQVDTLVLVNLLHHWINVKTVGLQKHFKNFKA